MQDNTKKAIKGSGLALAGFVAAMGMNSAMTPEKPSLEEVFGVKATQVVEDWHGSDGKDPNKIDYVYVEKFPDGSQMILRAPKSAFRERK